MKKSFKKFLKQNWIFLTILILITTWFFYSWFSKGIIFSLVNGDADSVIRFINSFGILAGIVFIFLVIFEVVFAPMPPLVLYVAAGFIFGGFLGGIYTLIGNLIGALIDFKIARKFGKKKIDKKMDKRLKKKFDKFFEKYGSYAIFILRVNPLTTSDLVSYLSGFTKIKTFKFLVATGLGLIPMIFIQTYFGDVFVKNNPVLSAIIILISLFYLLIFAYLIVKTFSKKE